MCAGNLACYALAFLNRKDRGVIVVFVLDIKVFEHFKELLRAGGHGIFDHIFFIPQRRDKGKTYAFRISIC